MQKINNSYILNDIIDHTYYTKQYKNLLIGGKMFTNPNGVHQSSSLIHNPNGHDPIGVNPMKIVLDTCLYDIIQIKKSKIWPLSPFPKILSLIT